MFFFFSILWAATALAQGPILPQTSLPDISIDAEIVSDTEGAPSRIRGTMTIVANEVGRDLCLYLPFNDPEYGFDRGINRRFEQLQGRTNPPIFQGGRSDIEILSDHVLQPTGPFPFIHRLQGRGEVRLRFDSVVPRLPKSPDDEWFYDGFYPMVARSCASSTYNRLYHRLVSPAHHHLRLKIPENWTFAGPGALLSPLLVDADATGNTLAFALLRNVITETRHFNNLEVRIHKRSAQFDKIVPTAEAAIAHLTTMFGPYPHRFLTIVETSELQRHILPGLLAVNQPKQAMFEAAQRDWLNWQHWMLATQLAMQYYGGVVTTASPDDDWLIQGIVEFGALETLRQLPQRYNLFNRSSEGYRWFSFDYLQISEISIASLAKYAPFSILTDEKYQTVRPLAEQHSLLFEKHTFAMRQLATYTGYQAFYGFLRNLTREYSFRTISPRDFMMYFNHLPSPFSQVVRRDIGKFLDQWWLSAGFPDFTLEEFENLELEGGRWLARVEVSQSGDIDFPPLIGVEDESGRTYYVRASRNDIENEGWHTEVLTSYKPTKAVVDPLHETYDANRFDNSSAWPEFYYFPGNAKTLKDDAYTLIWLPYPFRRPGEPPSIGLQSALFRYTQGSLFLNAEYAPSTRFSSFQGRYRYEMINRAMYTDLLLEHNYENDRLLDLSVVRSAMLPGDPQISMIGRLRHKDRPAQSDTVHSSGVIGLMVRPSGGLQDCIYNLTAEIEHAPKVMSHAAFFYERKMGALALSCNFAPAINARTRVFGGSTYKEGLVPPSALFRVNELREARIRLDLRGLKRVSKLIAINSDLNLPLYIPLPDNALILSRQIRFRLFYDYGHSFDQDLDYRAAGFGLHLPLGGDLSGAGAFSLTQLSLLVVTNSQAGDKVSRQPGILFDLTGQL